MDSRDLVSSVTKKGGNVFGKVGKKRRKFYREREREREREGEIAERTELSCVWLYASASELLGGFYRDKATRIWQTLHTPA
jgi:hypothetical protein